MRGWRQWALSASIAFGLAATSAGQGVDSPFRSPQPQPQEQAKPEAAPTTLDSFEFNGLMKFNGKVHVSVFDSKEQKNYWLTEGEVGELGLVLHLFDEEDEEVVIKRQGEIKRLALNETKIEPLRIANTPSAPPGAPVNGPATVTSSAPTPPRVETDEEARARIQRVAEEIRRRRAERRARLEERRDQEATQ